MRLRSRSSRSLPSRGLSRLTPGHAFQVHVDETNRTCPAKVLRPGGRVDPLSQPIRVIGEIGGRAGEPMAGMSGRVSLSPLEQPSQ